MRKPSRARGWQGNFEDWLGLLYNFNKSTFPAEDPRKEYKWLRKRDKIVAWESFSIKLNLFRLSLSILKGGGKGKTAC